MKERNRRLVKAQKAARSGGPAAPGDDASADAGARAAGAVGMDDALALTAAPPTAGIRVGTPGASASNALLLVPESPAQGAGAVSAIAEDGDGHGSALAPPPPPDAKAYEHPYELDHKLAIADSLVRDANGGNRPAGYIARLMHVKGFPATPELVKKVLRRAAALLAAITADVQVKKAARNVVERMDARLAHMPDMRSRHHAAAAARDAKREAAAAAAQASDTGGGVDGGNSNASAAMPDSQFGSQSQAGADLDDSLAGTIARNLAATSAGAASGGSALAQSGKPKAASARRQLELRGWFMWDAECREALWAAAETIAAWVDTENEFKEAAGRARQQYVGFGRGVGKDRVTLARALESRLFPRIVEKLPESCVTARGLRFQLRQEALKRQEAEYAAAAVAAVAAQEAAEGNGGEAGAARVEGAAGGDASAAGAAAGDGAAVKPRATLADMILAANFEESRDGGGNRHRSGLTAMQQTLAAFFGNDDSNEPSGKRRRLEGEEEGAPRPRVFTRENLYLAFDDPPRFVYERFFPPHTLETIRGVRNTPAGAPSQNPTAASPWAAARVGAAATRPASESGSAVHPVFGLVAGQADAGRASGAAAPRAGAGNASAGDRGYEVAQTIDLTGGN